ncbi:MAG: hypothetical protein IJ728_13115 [Selenomonadaceae bacterium]|nr:hypothetical protein [Selenomonadaceae bacterium]
MKLLEELTKGKSYNAHKYDLDIITDQPTIDYTEQTIVWEKSGETSQNKKYVPLKDYSDELARSDKQVLNYFLDGSRHVFKVDDIAFNDFDKSKVIYPVIAGQIGVGCCRRVDKKLTCENFIREFVLSLPQIANIDDNNGFFPAIVQQLNEIPQVKRLGIEFSKILGYRSSRTEKKFEDLGVALIQKRMMDQEQSMVSALVRAGKLNQDNYLVKDGSLEYKFDLAVKKNDKDSQRFKQNYNYVIGVSKKFNPTVCANSKGKSDPGFIADLPIYNRTPAACFISISGVEFAVWYIRIRDRKYTYNPFDGVIKVEKMLVTKSEIDDGMNSDLIDYLSALLINERNPVCYGSDLRWANHIYPIYLTEQYIKSQYISKEMFLQLF